MRADPLFWNSFLLTLKFVVIAVTIGFMLGFALAWLIWQFVARQRLLTTLLLIPMMLAPVAVGLIWRLLLQGDFGMVIYYLRAVGLLCTERRRASRSPPSSFRPSSRSTSGNGRPSSRW